MAEGPEPKRRRAEAGDGDGVAAGNGAEAEAGAGAGAGAEPGPGAPFPLSSVRLRRLLRDSAREKAAFVHGQVAGGAGGSRGGGVKRAGGGAWGRYRGAARRQAAPRGCGELPVPVPARCR